VYNDLDGRIAGLIDSGDNCNVGVESTVVECLPPSPLQSSSSSSGIAPKKMSSSVRVVILRPGGITAEQLEEVCGGKGSVAVHSSAIRKVDVQSLAEQIAASLSQALVVSPSLLEEADAAAHDDLVDTNDVSAAALQQQTSASNSSSSSQRPLQAPRAPGMRYRHYAPRAPLLIVRGDDAYLQRLVDETRQKGLKVGVLTTEEKVEPAASDSKRQMKSSSLSAKQPARFVFRADKVVACGRRDDLSTVARALYDSLRSFDESDVAIIFSEPFPQTGVGLAVMNRLLKAAAYRVVSSPSEAPPSGDRPSFSTS